MRVSPFTVAEESLSASSAMRGLGGMERTAAPKGPNMFDGGPASKVGENTQPFNNARMMQQNVLQNTSAAAPQAQANAVQQSRKMNLVEDNAEYKAQIAQELFDNRVKEIAYVMNTPGLDKLGSMTSIEKDAFRSNIANGKAMAMGVNPDLVQNQISEQRYG